MLLKMYLAIPLLAILLDLFIQDPEYWPHPVRLLGKLLDRCEVRARKQFFFSLKSCGIIVLVINIVLVGGVVYLLENLWILGFFISVYLAYAGLSLGDLIKNYRQIIFLVRSDQICEARVKLGQLVTRDTSHMDREQIYKTLAESCSENLNDGFVVPLFYLLLGGPVLLWIYKSVSTMDSMWGYKNDNWADLGWAGARADDFLAWVPARITAGLIIIVAFLLSHNWRDALDFTSLQAREMQSPNAGFPMAAVALSLDASMGGQAQYFGEETFKPLLGPYNIPWTEEKMDQLENVLIFSVFLCVLLGTLFLYTFYALF